MGGGYNRGVICVHFIGLTKNQKVVKTYLHPGVGRLDIYCCKDCEAQGWIDTEIMAFVRTGTLVLLKRKGESDESQE